MRKKWTSAAVKEAAITEYLNGSISYKALGKKYGVVRATVRKWVLNYYQVQKKCYPDWEFPGKYHRPSKPQTMPQLKQEELPKDIKLLQEELHKSRLHNQLLEAIIEIAEQDLGVEIRKKSGTRRS